MSMLNRNFARHSIDGGLLPSLLRGVLGMRESAVSGSGRRQYFIFWVGGIGDGERRCRGPWSWVQAMFTSCLAFKQTKICVLMFQVYYMFWGWSESYKGGVGHKTLSYLYYINSLCSGGFTVCDCKHVLVRSVLGAWHWCVSYGNVHGWVRQLDTSPSMCHWTVEVYVPQDPHQGSVVVFGYTYVPCEHYTPNIYRWLCT